ncbi:unnamed protein product [Rotaria sp. Silwood2]|nr:unnamed protein product [Rotaria sp. Silwood2]
MSRIVRSTFDTETIREQIMNDINEEYDNYLRQDVHYHAQNKERIYRNILLVGLSKSGKSTLGHILEDPRYIPKELTLSSISDTEIQCTWNIFAEPNLISLNIIEIPGYMINENSSLSDINRTCIELGITELHLVCFCTSLITGIDGYAIKLFTRFIQHFGEEQIRDNLCFIITQCEMKNEEQRQSLRDEFLYDTECATLTKNQVDRIYFSGALNPDDYKSANDVLFYQFETVNNYRKKLLQLIQSDIKPIHLSSTRPPTHLTKSPLSSISE